MEGDRTKITIDKKVYNLEDENDTKQFVEYIHKNVLLFPKHFPSTHKVIVLFVLSTCVTIFLGILISIYFNNWLWFSRFGSICVAIAVLLIFYDISDYYDKNLRAIGRSFLFIKSIVEAHFKKILKQPHLTKEQIAEIELLHQNTLKMLDEQASSTDDIAVRHEQQIKKSKLRTCEACILILGTLIWGFGDLVGVLLKKVGG